MTRLHRWFAALAVSYALVGAGCGDDMDMEPNPPSDLKVSEVTGGAHLTWKDNSDNEASFMVERKVGNGAFETLATVPFNTTQHHDGPLLKDTMYMYRVMAMAKEGGHATSTKYSNEVTFKLAIAP